MAVQTHSYSLFCVGGAPAQSAGSCALRLLLSSELPSQCRPAGSLVALRFSGVCWWHTGLWPIPWNDPRSVLPACASLSFLFWKMGTVQSQPLQSARQAAGQAVL